LRGGRAEKTYADDALGADQLDELVLDAALGVALAVGLDVTEVANVALLVAGGTVGLVVGVDCVGQLLVVSSVVSIPQGNSQ
jgi:hypothetical protein